MMYFLWLELHMLWHRRYIRRTGERSIGRVSICYERECTKCNRFVFHERLWYLPE
jgi:hypothetical protein